MQVVIQPATKEDAPGLAKVEVTSWRTAYRELIPEVVLNQLSEAAKVKAWQENILKHQLARRKRVLVAHHASEVIGFVRVGPVTEAERLGLVYLLYVLPQYWRRGVGKNLMGAAMNELKELGLDMALLWVLRDNQRARQFYEKFGWQLNGQTSSETYGGVQLETLCYQRAVSG